MSGCVGFYRHVSLAGHRCSDIWYNLIHLQAGLRRVAFQNVGASIKACRAFAELLPDFQNYL